MRLRHLAILTLSGAIFALAQAPPPDPIVLPADKADAEITLPLRSELPKGAKVNPPRLLGPKGVPISPQPVFADPVVTADKLSLKISKIYFWGDATLQFEPVPGLPGAYPLRRGPALASTEVPTARRGTGQLWLYNFDTQPAAVRWRIVSGAETLCGIKDGQPLRDCATPDKWSAATLGPARSDVIAFAAPDWWFNPWQAFCACVRQAQLELLFGDDAAAPLLRLPLTLRLDARVWEGWWLPAWVGPAWTQTLSFLFVMFWVTLGAILLMMAQVMIPNFRKSLRMESQIESLQGRLRAVGSGVGDSRLYARSHRELETLSMDLAMGQTQAKSKFLSVDRLALAGNTAEVDRISAMLPRVEARIRLMERLDEIQPAALESASGDVPPSLCWDRARRLRDIQDILSGQVISAADEKAATAILDLLADTETSVKNFAAELETRIDGLRRLVGQEPWKSKYVALIAGLNGCAELVPAPASTAVPVTLSTDELVFRDVAAVRLAVVCQMIAIEPLLGASPTVQAEVLKKLQSDDPAKLSEARIEVLKLSQGVSEKDVRTALENLMWDAYYEPDAITERDVLHGSFVFGDKDINRSAAKNSFQCYWAISPTEDPRDAVYESGWEAEFMPLRGAMHLTPLIYGPDGKEVIIRPDVGKNQDKGVVRYDVVTQPPRARLMRGFIDALMTAVVPVISVAITQIKAQSTPDFYTLVMLGFTSQAIRAVVVPDPVPPAPELPPAKAPATDVKA